MLIKEDIILVKIELKLKIIKLKILFELKLIRQKVTKLKDLLVLWREWCAAFDGKARNLLLKEKNT